MNRMTEVLPKLAKQLSVEVIGLEVNSVLINSIVSCLPMHEKEEFQKGVVELIEKYFEFF
jgi:hypothetical protein